jgi:hypothetical protein
MSNRDEIRLAIVMALNEVQKLHMGAQSNSDLADAAIAAYEAHRPRADVVLTEHEWPQSLDKGCIAWRQTPYTHPATKAIAAAFRAAFPWIRVEGE